MDQPPLGKKRNCKSECDPSTHYSIKVEESFKYFSKTHFYIKRTAIFITL